MIVKVCPECGAALVERVLIADSRYAIADRRLSKAGEQQGCRSIGYRLLAIGYYRRAGQRGMFDEEEDRHG
jgi:hypothetical protein